MSQPTPFVTPAVQTDSWLKRRARTWRRASRGLPLVALLAVTISVVLALIGPWLAAHSAVDPNLGVRLHPPIFFGGTADHLLGTDAQGRDVLSRIIIGVRYSLLVGVAAVLAGGTVGSLLGLVSGYRGGWVDAVLMRIADATLAFPTILLALVLALTVGPSFGVVAGVLAFLLWARYARLVRGQVLSLREREYVSYARVAGASTGRIIRMHLVPNVFDSVVVLSTLQIGWAIVVEASLGFLGAGIPPPTPTWGGMIGEGRDYLATAWWMAMSPGFAILMLVVSLNLLGDWLRDVLDPQLRQV